MSHPSDPKKLPQVVRAILEDADQTKIARTNEEINIDRTSDEAPSPALELHSELQFAFKFVNDELLFPIYGVRLPDVMFTVVRSRRFAGAFCYRTYERKEARESDISEIIVNPFLFSSPAEVLQTLAHEMVHLAQAELGGVFGEPSERGYHNKKFAAVMQSIGLKVVNINDLSKSTGYRMTDFVIEGGPFEKVRQRYLEIGGTISWAAIDEKEDEAAADDERGAAALEARKRDAKRKRDSKTAFTCPKCTQTLWGKPSSFAICGFCSMRLASPGAKPTVPPAA